MFPREMQYKRKKDQDFSPVKHRCPSDLNVSMYSQDENDNSLHEPYSAEVEALIYQDNFSNEPHPEQSSWSAPGPWKPVNDDPQMKQLEEDSFLALESSHERTMMENNEVFPQYFQDFKSTDMHKGDFSFLNQEVDEGPYLPRRLFKENKALEGRSPNEYGKAMKNCPEYRKGSQSLNYDHGVEIEKHNYPLSFQSSNYYSKKYSYNNENEFNVANYESKNENIPERRKESENNSTDDTFSYPSTSTEDESPVFANSRAAIQTSDLYQNSRNVLSSSYQSYSNEINLNVSKNQFKDVNETTNIKQKVDNDLADNVLPYSLKSTVEVSNDPSTSTDDTNSKTKGQFSSLNPKSKEFYPNNQQCEKPLVNKFPPGFNVKDQRFSKSASNSLAQTLRTLNKTLSKGQDFFSDYNQSKCRTLQNYEKNINIDATKEVMKNQERFENESFKKYSNYDSKQMFRSNTYNTPWNQSNKTSVSSSDCKNWRQIDNIEPHIEKQPCKSLNNFSWRYTHDLSSSAKPGIAWSSKTSDSSSTPSAESQNWRTDSLNTSSDDNWRHVDSGLRQIVKVVIGKREGISGKEYLCRWIGTRVDTWEKEDTLKMLHMAALQNYLDREMQISKETTQLLNKRFVPGFIDTHCHLDFIYNKLKTTESGRNYRNVCEKEYKFPLSYEGCITCFCDPQTFRQIRWYTEFLENTEVYAAFGCHPHHSNNFGEMEETYLKIALQSRKTIALGEIGLDYSGRNDHSKDLQREVFKRQLIIAMDLKKPLVIHCRDAHDDCIQILKETVPDDIRIHRHCFTEPWDKATEWLSLFKNCFIGITNLISQNSKRGSIVRQVAAEMPLERLLLETDAPYFHPNCLSDDPSGQTRYVSNPGMALYVASEIAKVRGCPVTEVLTHARNNTRKMYGI